MNFMKMNSKYKLASKLSIVMLLIAMVSCNKDVPAPVPVTFPAPSGSSIAEVLTANPSYSFLLAAVTKVGLATAVSNKNAVFTVFAPDNNAMKQFINIASGGLIPLNAPDAAFLNFINNQVPVATLASVINYHIIPGRQINSTAIPTTFPNVQMPSNFIIPAPNTNPLVRFSIFPSRRGSSAWANNIPVTQADIAVANGVIHAVPAVIAPPTRVLLDTIARDPDFAYLVAAVVRADSGLASNSTARLQYALGEPLASLTVFAPTNTAFQTLLTGAIAQALIAQGVPPATALAQATALASTPAVFSNPALYPVLTAQLVRGIVAYHVLGQRAFTVNFPTTGASFPTLLNGAIPSHPGVTVTSSLTGPFGTGLTVKGIVNTTASTAAATATGVDRQAINGVFYKIDQVLLPQ
jgi:uncharacterized surface protein with fasciclin (FAS1) repeats